VKKKDKAHAAAPQPPEPEPEAQEAAGLPASDDGDGTVLPVEPDAEAIERLHAQVADFERQATEWKDRALRTAADLDNYRRRAIKEREEALTRGQGEVLSRIVEVVDDLARVAHLDPANTSAQALHDGMLAIERKFMKLLESSGVERVDPAGAAFDPTAHEAVTMMPAPGPEADNTVGAVFQPGYRLRGVLLRPAKVAVMRWTAPADAVL
jgi:molecular chaperone GrpE